MVTNANWTKGLDTRLSASEAAVGVNNPDGIGDGYTRLGMLQGYAINLVNGTTPAARLYLASLLPKIHGAGAASISFWKTGDPEPTTPEHAIADLGAAFLDFDQTEVGTQIWKCAIYDAADVKLDEIEGYTLVQDNLGIGAP